MRLFAVLLVFSFIPLGGCFAAEQPSAESPGNPGFFESFSLADNAPVSITATGAILRWEGSVAPNAAGMTGAKASADLHVPAGDNIIIFSVLTWDAGPADLELYVRDEQGRVRCSSTTGFIVTPATGESCRTGAYEGRETTTLTIEVVALDNPNAEMPFVVEVHVESPARPAVDAEVAARFGEPVLVGTGADGETSLFIAPDGTMLVCTHGGFQKPSPLWASLDFGATWTEFDPQPNPVPSGDCDVAITDDGTWYMSYDTLASATVASSTDQGRTWQVQPIAAHPLTGAVDRQWLLPDGNDITMTYANAAATLPAAHWFTRSTDRGLTWPTHIPMGTAEGPGKVQKIPGHPISWDNGREILAPTLARQGSAGVDVTPSTLILHRSHDAGLTWSSQSALAPFEAAIGFPGAARSPDGTLFLSFARGDLGNSTIQVAWSFDDGATWSDPLIVAREVASRMTASPFIDARSDGTATLTWMQDAGEADRLPGNQVWVARVDPRAAEPLVFSGGITEPYAATFGYEFIMLRHDASDRTHVAYIAEGEGCADDPASERRRLCLYVVREAAP